MRSIMLFLLSVVCAFEQVHTQGTFDSTQGTFVAGKGSAGTR